jgi:predicted DNA-binding transcriptional regulator YafY
VLVAWCERRRGFRHFRADRIAACKPAGRHFTGEGEALRARWREQHRMP